MLVPTLLIILLCSNNLFFVLSQVLAVAGPQETIRKTKNPLARRCWELAVSEAMEVVSAAWRVTRAEATPKDLEGSAEAVADALQAAEVEVSQVSQY